MATTKKRHRFDRDHLIPIYDLEDPNDETEEFNFLIPGQSGQSEAQRVSFHILPTFYFILNY